VKLAAVIASALILFAMTGPGRASDVSTLRGFGTAIVDGVLTVNEWEGAGRFAFQAQGGQGTFYVMNDSQNLYLALRAPDPHVGASVFDGIFLAPPPNVFGAGSDNLHVTPGTFEDLFNRQVTPTYWDWLADVADGGTRDGLAVVRTADGELVYEIAHPLNSGDNRHDFSLPIPSHISFTGVFQSCLGCGTVSYIPASTGGLIVIVSGTHVPPETTITAGPADGAEVPGYGQFAFAAVDEVAPPSEMTYECKVDGQGWSACESPLTGPATEDGWHTVSVRAFDEMLNVDPTPAKRRWRIDTQAPSKPKVVAAGRPGASRTQLRISATDRGTPSRRIRFRCKVDAKPFQACTYRYRVRLRTGRHVLRFSAIDPAGNRSPVKIVRLVVR
jgi:hypothetical protein